MSGPAIGSASILIDLKHGSIKIYHGTDKTLLAEKLEAQGDDWEFLWKAFKAMGIKSLHKGN